MSFISLVMFSKHLPICPTAIPPPSTHPRAEQKLTGLRLLHPCIISIASESSAQRVIDRPVRPKITWTTWNSFRWMGSSFPPQDHCYLEISTMVYRVWYCFQGKNVGVVCRHMGKPGLHTNLNPRIYKV